MAEKCVKIKELMAEALDGALAPEAQAAFDGHLASCAACRRRYEALGAAVSLFEAAPAAEPSPAFVAEVMRRARRARARETTLRRAYSWVTASATAAVAAGAVVFGQRVFGPQLASALKGLASPVTAALVDAWRVWQALAVPTKAFGKVASTLASAGSQWAAEGLVTSAPAYAGAFVAIAAFYLIWRMGRLRAAPPVSLV
jgi:anti-sigma factor RsiW